MSNYVLLRLLRRRFFANHRRFSANSNNKQNRLFCKRTIRLTPIFSGQKLEFHVSKSGSADKIPKKLRNVLIGISVFVELIVNNFFWDWKSLFYAPELMMVV